VPVGAAVVDHDDFVRDLVQPQLEVKMFDRGGDAPLLIAGRYDHRKQGERGLGRG
jgi:hypothetical protein